MIIFLYGQDTYRSKEELRKMIEKNKQSNVEWLDFVRIDASDKQIDIFEELKKTINTIPMFSTAKMMIIDNIFDLNNDKQGEILEFLKKSKIDKNENITIVFWADEVNGKSVSSADGLQKYLKSRAEYKEFKLLEPAKVKQWIKEFVANQKASIDNSAVEKLAEWVGNDLWRMSNELNKLVAYNPTIRHESVELFIGPEIDLKIFDLVDAIGYKNKSKALKLFNQHIDEGADLYYLLSMIAYQFRNLIKIKTTKAIELLGLNPFVARKSEQQAHNFTYEELKKIYSQLMIIDFESKLGKTNVQTALELVIFGL